jgi:hypothetical protein
MKVQRRHLIIGGAILALSAGGAGVAVATSGGDEGDTQATGPGSEKARAAALQITHGGTANAVERDSENGATWEVEVTKPDGKTVDVRLDENCKLVVVEGDSEKEDGAEGPGDSER